MAANKKPWQAKTTEDPICSQCSGTGFIGKERCGACEGDGRVYGKATLDARRKAAQAAAEAEPENHELQDAIDADPSLLDKNNV